MPYISAQRREALLEEKRAEWRPPGAPLSTGELTYVIQQEIAAFLRPSYDYGRLADVLGALEGAKLDFIERVVKPYEHLKCATNGDAWPSDLLVTPVERELA